MLRNSGILELLNHHFSINYISFNLWVRDFVFLNFHCTELLKTKMIWMGQCKKDVTPLLAHWSYIFLALTHRYDIVHHFSPLRWCRSFKSFLMEDIYHTWSVPCLLMACHTRSHGISSYGIDQICPEYSGHGTQRVNSLRLSVRVMQIRADSRFVPSQWQTALLCNDVSHWLGASLESALISIHLAIIGSGNGLSFIWCQTIFWTNADLL